MFITLIILFVIGYIIIALEHPLKVDKTATALLLGMLMWILYAFGAEYLVPMAEGEELSKFIAENPHEVGKSLYHQALDYILNVKIVESLGDITQTLLFLIGAMTIVELIDVHDGFSVITSRINTRKKSRLLWVVCLTTFVFSAILDNMTTTIVMIMLLRKLIANKKERWIYAAMVVIAANTGGAWSPIGDVTTIMLWVKGNVTAPALIKFVLLPSLVALLVPLIIVSRRLKGNFPEKRTTHEGNRWLSAAERNTMFILGVGGLIFVPIFKSITHMPPFVGILFVLGVLWVYTEIFYNRKQLNSKFDEMPVNRLPRLIARIDMPSILFFLGILMAVSVLQATGVLSATAAFLDEEVHNIYAINVLLGVLSSIVDNVPLVAGVMGMYPVVMDTVQATGYQAAFVIDGVFWEFLSYCAGVGGSILIIGSAAGVIAMGIEKINFGWYLKKFSLLAFAGYLAGAAVYILEVFLFK